jgi:hypothetical protein
LTFIGLSLAGAVRARRFGARAADVGDTAGALPRVVLLTAVFFFVFFFDAFFADVFLVTVLFLEVPFLETLFAEGFFFEAFFEPFADTLFFEVFFATFFFELFFAVFFLLRAFFVTAFFLRVVLEAFERFFVAVFPAFLRELFLELARARAADFFAAFFFLLADALFFLAAAFAVGMVAASKTLQMKDAIIHMGSPSGSPECAVFGAGSGGQLDVGRRRPIRCTMLHDDSRIDTAAYVELGSQTNEPRGQKGPQIVEDPVGDGLVESADVSVRGNVQL